MPPTDFVSDFIDKLSKHQKRAVLTCTRDGLLTDESFLNVFSYTGPDRIQVTHLIIFPYSYKKIMCDLGVNEKSSRRDWRI
jgi:hypothetical protein